MRTLPKESISTSAAPASINRLNPRVSACPIERPRSFSETFSHSLTGYTERQLSSPCVTTISFPSSLRNFEGREILFFVSSVCLYSPISMKICGQEKPMRRHRKLSKTARKKKKMCGEEKHKRRQRKLSKTEKKKRVCAVSHGLPLHPTCYKLYTIL